MMKRYPLIYINPARTPEDLFVTQGVFNAIKERFCSGVVQPDSEEYGELSRAFWSIAHNFDSQVRRKYEDALGIQSELYEDRLSSTSDASKKTV